MNPKKIFIAGAGGGLGSELVSFFTEKGIEVYASSHADLDITDRKKTLEEIERYMPDLVINCAALSRVEACEENPERAFAINAVGAYHLAIGAELAGAVSMYISTDYVFDGSKNTFSEEDIPSPLNVYGVSKLSGELLVRSVTEKYYIIRTSALFGGKKDGGFGLMMEKKAQSNETARVVSDVVTSPTSLPQLAAKIYEIVQKTAPYGVYHVTNQGEGSWYDLAKKIFELVDTSGMVLPITADESGGRARRPKRTVLENKALIRAGIPLLPVWDTALCEFYKK
jgi:dTDP-4-dehydrorhamnose reductase